MSETTQATPNNAGAATPAQSSLETPITQVVTATPPVTPPAQTQDDPVKRVAELEKELERTRKEAANRRVENRDIKTEKSELEKQVEALTSGLKDVSTTLESEKAARETAEREAALVRNMAKYDLPESSATLFEGVPTDKIEEKAKALKDLIGNKAGGYKTTVGSTGSPPAPSMAQKIFDRMTGKGPSPFDADYHKAVGGGVIEP